MDARITQYQEADFSSRGSGAARRIALYQLLKYYFIVIMVLFLTGDWTTFILVQSPLTAAAAAL